MNALRIPRVPLAAVLFVALAIILFACNVRADISTSTPVFTWTAESGATEYRLRCDGSNSTVYWAAPAELTWTAPEGKFAPGPHTCFVMALTGATPNPQTNVVSFTIPPAVVVVPPPVPFVLSVQ